MEKIDTLNLKKRYLIWLYKTTKEALDKIERKFTQLEIDKSILKELQKKGKGKGAEKLIADFQAYILNKELDAADLKTSESDYRFLTMKLEAIEKTTSKTLGSKGLAEIKALYEREMIERILKSTEQK